MSEGLLDIETIRRFKGDDTSAFDTIYHAYCEKIFRFSISIIKNKTDAEGIVQDVFIKIWEHRKKIDENLSFESYLFTIAHNTIISLMRKRCTENHFKEHLRSIQDTTSRNFTIMEVEFNELKNETDHIIERLPTRQKQIYKLNREKGYTYKEIASLLNISQNTVETHMERAMKSIRAQIGDIEVAR